MISFADYQICDVRCKRGNDDIWLTGN